MNPMRSSNSVHQEPETLLELIEGPQAPREHSIRLASGRSLHIEEHASRETLIIKGNVGGVLLRVLLDDSGPTLLFEHAHLALASTGDLELSGRNVRISASRDLRLDVQGDHHTRVGGRERLEAASVEVQANEGDLALRAHSDIRLDGEMIGLNDSPVPVPFEWSNPAAAIKVESERHG